MDELIIVNKTTGEEIDKINPGDSYRITRKKTKQYLESTEQWNFKNFYQTNVDEIKEVNKNLNIYEKGLLQTIAPYLGYEDCLLKHSNGVPLDWEDLLKLTKISKSQLSTTIKSLIKKNILFKQKVGRKRQYYLNPYLFFKGDRVKINTKKYFEVQPIEQNDIDKLDPVISNLIEIVINNEDSLLTNLSKTKKEEIEPMNTRKELANIDEIGEDEEETNKILNDNIDEFIAECRSKGSSIPESIILTWRMGNLSSFNDYRNAMEKGFS